jgi:predicted DsbA family dithiol-disulfide isomerase
MPLRIDLVSDVVCPWCVIGYLQLRQALDERAGLIDLDLHWHPFELNPRMGPDGQDLREHVEQKYGASAGDRRGSRERLQEAGQALGFAFNYGEGFRIVNTFRAHQLLHWAGLKEQQTELKLALFRANFTDSRNVDDPAVLVDIAGSVGLDREEAEAVLADARYGQQVREQERRWVEEGIQAVPTFLVDERFMVQGAQDSRAFGRMLDRLLEKHAA